MSAPGADGDVDETVRIHSPTKTRRILGTSVSGSLSDFIARLTTAEELANIGFDGGVTADGTCHRRRDRCSGLIALLPLRTRCWRRELGNCSSELFLRRPGEAPVV